MPKLVPASGALLLVACLALAQSPDVTKSCSPADFAGVLTHRNNNYRTGANLQETCLTPANVKASSFGKLFTLHVTGQVYAQPLMITDIEIKGKKRNALYVATMENWVYAFDADGANRDKNGVPQPLWSKWLGPPLPVNRIPKDIGAALGKYNIEPFVGITSTPVIDRPLGLMFLVAKIAKIGAVESDCDGQVATEKCPVENRIFAIDLITGAIRSSRKIHLPEPEPAQTESPELHPCGLLDDRKPTKYDAGRINMQRPALLLTIDRDDTRHIYLGFGSHQDAPCPMYHGMMIRFDFDRLHPQLRQFPTTFLVSKLGEADIGINDIKNLGKGGIWQAGNGPAADDAGNVYVMTGNGSFEENVQFGSNFVKLSPDLKVVDWFAPWNVKLLNADALDIDLGSSGPVLMPGSGEIVGGGKQGKVYLLDTAKLGSKQKFGWPRARTDPPIQSFWAARRWQPEFIYGWFPISLFAFATGYHHIHGAPAYWGESDSQGTRGSIYIWPERDRVKAFAYKKDAADKHGKFTTKASARGPEAGKGMPGGFLSISADHMKNGILWAALPMHDDAWIDIVRGALRAFEITPDGETLTPLWTSYCADKDDRFNFAKNVPPTVANGKVYLATFSNFVAVYGPRSGPDAPADCKVSEFMMEPSYRKTHHAAGHH